MKESKTSREYMICRQKIKFEYNFFFEPIVQDNKGRAALKKDFTL